MRHQAAGGGGGVAVQDGIDGIVAGVTLQLLQFEKPLWGWVVQWGNGAVTL